jgi:predicted Zn-dependent protease with MMP-like domain
MDRLSVAQHLPRASCGFTIDWTVKCGYPVAMEFETLSQWADEELKSLVKILPDDVQQAAKKVVISLEEQPGQGMDDETLEGDELGLFEGPMAMDEEGSGEIPKIRLFLMNIWEYAEEEEHDYRDEVGTTFLHELGHYLGWDEEEIAERGLE